jgi:hypothetical protein
MRDAFKYLLIGVYTAIILVVIVLIGLLIGGMDIWDQ